MNIPQFWAEGRAQHRERGRQVTVRRFGWSDTSEAEAQAAADTRATEALRRILAGEKLLRREPKAAYNGAEGVPIREEIVARHGLTVITRNAYGALCLNTPDALFADVDFPVDTPPKLGCGFMLALLIAAALIAGQARSWGLFLVLALVAAVGGWWLASAVHRLFLKSKGGPEQQARQRVKDFLRTHQEWRLRLYRTPAGLRLLAVHRPFAPGEAAVTEFFQALHTDPVYVQMCQRQQCFRARVTPKPWRIGIAAHMKPWRGGWPVGPDVLPARKRWVEAYHEKSRGFAACEFVEELGHGGVHDRVRETVRLHDELCRAQSGLPIA